MQPVERTRATLFLVGCIVLAAASVFCLDGLGVVQRQLPGTRGFGLPELSSLTGLTFGPTARLVGLHQASGVGRDRVWARVWMASEDGPGLEAQLRGVGAPAHGRVAARPMEPREPWWDPAGAAPTLEVAWPAPPGGRCAAVLARADGDAVDLFVVWRG